MEALIKKNVRNIEKHALSKNFSQIIWKKTKTMNSLKTIVTNI